MLSPSLEDYLEEIYRFSLSSNVVRISDIAACLNVTLPSVNNAVRKLSAEGYLIYKKYKEIVLTNKGRMLGKFLVERNRILQDFIVLINSDCNVPAEAEAMEHYLSLPTIRTIEHLLDFMYINKDCYKKFLSHSLYRESQGLGLTDGYKEEGE